MVQILRCLRDGEAVATVALEAALVNKQVSETQNAVWPIVRTCFRSVFSEEKQVFRCFRLCPEKGPFSEKV